MCRLPIDGIPFLQVISVSYGVIDSVTRKVFLMLAMSEYKCEETLRKCSDYLCYKIDKLCCPTWQSNRVRSEVMFFVMTSVQIRCFTGSLIIRTSICCFNLKEPKKDESGKRLHWNTNAKCSNASSNGHEKAQISQAEGGKALCPNLCWNRIR